MKRPSFQFYPADWKNNSKLRRCSEAARGAWVDVLCLLHDSDEYGICRWPLAELARSAGVPLKLIKELVTKDVLKGADNNAAPYIFTPRHAGKNGDPVTLVVAGDQPCWYCSRFVRDEWIRQRRGQSTQFSADNQPPKQAPKGTPNPTFGDRQGDGPTSSSTSTLTTSVPIGTGAEAPPVDQIAMVKKELWAEGKALFASKDIASEKAGKIIGQLLNDYSPEIVLDAVRACVKAESPDPTAYLTACCQTAAGERAKGNKNSRHSGFDKTDYKEGVTPDGRIA